MATIMGVAGSLSWSFHKYSQEFTGQHQRGISEGCPSGYSTCFVETVHL